MMARKTLHQWKKWIDAHSVNQDGVYFINSDWVVQELEKDIEEGT